MKMSNRQPSFADFKTFIHKANKNGSYLQYDLRLVSPIRITKTSQSAQHGLPFVT